MFLIDAIKHNVERKKNPVLFLFMLCFLAATKTLFKRNEKKKSTAQTNSNGYGKLHYALTLKR